MAKVILRQEAIDDLNDIWDYTFERWSEDQADKYYSMLKFACERIGVNPDIGKKYAGIKRGLLGFKSEKHIIFYQTISEGEIVVMRLKSIKPLQCTRNEILDRDNLIVDLNFSHKCTNNLLFDLVKSAKLSNL